MINEKHEEVIIRFNNENFIASTIEFTMKPEGIEFGFKNKSNKLVAYIPLDSMSETGVVNIVCRAVLYFLKSLNTTSIGVFDVPFATFEKMMI